MSEQESPLLDSSRPQSSPKSKPSSPTFSSDNLISQSTSNIHDKSSKTDESKRNHSILGIFSRKHQPPTSLENIPSKVKSRHDSSSATPSSSQSFLHKLPFYGQKHSPSSTPVGSSSSFTAPGGNLANPKWQNRPTELLFPVQEMDSIVVDETAENEATEGPRQASKLDIASPNEDQWFETDTADGINEVDGPVYTHQLSMPNDVSEAISTRDATIKDLEDFLVQFRSGQLQALTNGNIAAMRQMHEEQCAISNLQMRIHAQLMQFGFDSENEGSFDSSYQSLGAKLDHLHELMENFSFENEVTEKSESSTDDSEFVDSHG
uniref:GAT domain-containing protein n=1 Tax=Panagrellus redivivus TaxID=6233 RepID=A0A7E4V718_PANRE